MKAEMAEEHFTPFPHFSTLAIHAGQDPRQWNSRAIVPPISLATTFQQDEPGVFPVSNKRSFSCSVLNLTILTNSRNMSTHDPETLRETLLKNAWLQ